MSDRPRRLRRFLTRALIALVAFGTLGSAGTGLYYYRISRAALPQTDGRLALHGLAAEVEVLRDAWGVPHLFAATASDAYLAQGYVTAQDRLWQMDMLRRSASGELSELVGERAYAHDVAQRRLGLRRAAEAALETVPPDARESLEQYARGVNAFIAQTRESLPLEFRLLNYDPSPWTPVDSLVIGKLMAQTLGTTWQQDVMRERFRSELDPDLYRELFVETTPYDVPFIGADTPVDPAPVPEPSRDPAPRPAPPAPRPERAPAVPDLDLFLALLEPASDDAPRGSNNWVVAGSRTRSGKPLLANDPHLELGIPPIWHAVHLRVADGSLAVAGVTFPGAPGVVIGHNGHIGWGVTNFNPDVQDVFAVRFDESGRRYVTSTGMDEVEVRRERIRVRRDTFGTEVEERVEDTLVTRYGPIVSGEGAVRYALRWTALDPAAELTAFFLLNRATDWASFRDALRQYPGPTQNFVYADTTGNIGYCAAGFVPVRATGSGDVPCNAGAGDGEWVGYVPFDDLPHVYNPGRGFVATANNRVVGTAVPTFFTREWIAPFRARRIDELISSRADHTVETMAAIQGDVYSYPHAIFARELLEVARERVASGSPEAEWRAIVNLLEGWDGRLTVDSAPAAVVTPMRRHFNERILRGRLGALSREYKWFSRESLFARIVEDRPAQWLPDDVRTWEELFLESYRAATAELAGKLGADRGGWRYGRLNTFTFTHPLGGSSGLGAIFNASAVEMDGGSHTVKAFMGDQPKKWGSSIRFVVDFADVDGSTLNLTTGESGIHASPHYLDQVDDWRTVRPHTFPFSEAAIRAAATAALRLTPAP